MKKLSLSLLLLGCMQAYAQAPAATAAAVPAYPTTTGWAVFLSIFILLLVVAIPIILVVIFSRRNNFSLKDALSENVQVKTTIPNPEYSADKMRAWLRESSSNTLVQLEKGWNDRKALLAAAEGAVTDAGAGVTPEQTAALAAARKDAQDASDTYFTALKHAVTSGTANPTALSSLSNMFPPTIEVTGDFDTDRLAMLLEAIRRRNDLETAAAPQLQAWNKTADVQTVAELQSKGARTADEEQQLRVIRQIVAAGDEVRNILHAPSQAITHNYRPSISRLIAFLSAILLFGVGLCAAFFFLNFYLIHGVPPDLSKLTGILLGLGIGLAPYTVNKVANAASDKDKTI